jgi:hypothetical protein
MRADIQYADMLNVGMRPALLQARTDGSRWPGFVMADL